MSLRFDADGVCSRFAQCYREGGGRNIISFIKTSVGIIVSTDRDVECSGDRDELDNHFDRFSFFHRKDFLFEPIETIVRHGKAGARIPFFSMNNPI